MCAHCATPDAEEWTLESGEVAELGHVSLHTVRRYVARGWLEARRLPSGRYRFRRADVERVFSLTPSA